MGKALTSEIDDDITFGFTWISGQAYLETKTEKNVTDFEGRWQANPSESGNLNVECGKCAEHLWWVELSNTAAPK